MLTALRRRILDVPCRRPPDFIIGDSDRPYLRRWWLIPRNRFANAYLHHFLRSDDDRALHDHPCPSISIVLIGGYWERIPLFPKRWPEDRTTVEVWRKPGAVVARKASDAHRIILPEDCRPVWSLFLTGPRIREWGFWCPQGWIDWKTFTDPDNYGRIGRGCE